MEVSAQEKERIIKGTEEVASMKVFKVRLTTDDGWFYFVEPTKQWAIRRYPNREVYPATQRDLELIALRALTGNY